MPPPPSSLAAALPTPSRRQRRRRPKGRTVHVHFFNYYHYPLPPLVEEEREWTELPLDATLSILSKLDPAELLGPVAGVCRLWRRATRDEPGLWRHIDMRHCSRDRPLDSLAREVLRRSAGRCEAFAGEYFGDDDFLLFLADHAPSLGSLCLGFFPKLTSEGFAEAISKFHFLEKLELSNCHGVDVNTGVFELVAKACPRLKHFSHIKYRDRYYQYCIDDPHNDRLALAIGKMHELRSLKLYRDTLTNGGLAGIVNNCQHLEFLDIRSCGNITMNDALLQAKCARIKIKILVPRRGKDDGILGGFQPGSNISFCSTCMMSEFFRMRREKESRISGPDDYYDPYYYYLSALDEANLEEHGRLLGKKMRRYNL